MMFIMQGCGAKNNTICPTYPKTTQVVLDKIKSLKDENVDNWMIEQYKLNLKLGVCKE
jgi:hypothetical protein